MKDYVTTVRRHRGRPRGTGKDDQATLDEMPVLMIADTKLKPTTAAKRVVKGIEGTHLRRLQVKWKASSSPLIAAARARFERRRQERVRGVEDLVQWPPRKQRWEIGAVDDSPIVKTLRALKGSPAVEGMREFEAAKQKFVELPFMKTLRALQDDPAMKQVWEFQESMQKLSELPFIKNLRALQESPAMKQMREFQDSMQKLQCHRS